jgi:Xaa-Pro aminopeptidase
MLDPAYLLNLRGWDILFNSVFQAYFFISLDRAVLFIDSVKVTGEVCDYLHSLGVERMDYSDFWSFLRRREWGEGKILISPQTSYAISLMLTHFRYTVKPSIVDDIRAIKNEIELEGIKCAYLRDGVSFVRWLAWLKKKQSQGYSITEYEAAWRLTEFRKLNMYFLGLAYENISASGLNAGMCHSAGYYSGCLIIMASS